MRSLTLLFFASTTLSSGCASMIARTGTDLTQLKTKDEIHARMGNPHATGVAEGKCFEEYRTRRKIAEPHCLRHDELYCWRCVFTFGVYDLLCIPQELYLVGQRTLLGQTIRVIYDDAENVEKVRLDGDSL